MSTWNVECNNPSHEWVAKETCCLIPSRLKIVVVIISWWFSSKTKINNLTFWLTVTVYCSFRRRPPICWRCARNQPRPEPGLGFLSPLASGRWSGPGWGPPPAPQGGSWSQTPGWCGGVVRPMLRKKRKDRISYEWIFGWKVLLNTHQRWHSDDSRH